MTPLPKRKHSRARKGRRRSSINLKLANLAKCPNCQTYKKPHMVCGNCGFYGGKEILKPKPLSKKHEKPA